MNNHDTVERIDYSPGALAATAVAVVVLLMVIALFLVFRFSLLDDGTPGDVHASLGATVVLLLKD